MLARIPRTFFLLLSALAISSVFAPPLTTTAQSSQDSAQLEIKGVVTTPLTLSIADLKKLPRTTLHVDNTHEKKSEVYEGVLLNELLRKAGVPYGEKLRGPLMTTCIVAEASDGYRVLFSLAELDTDFMNSEVLVADTLDGASIDVKRGPLRLVAPHDRRPARWVRMLKSIVVSSPKDAN